MILVRTVNQGILLWGMPQANKNDTKKPLEPDGFFVSDQDSASPDCLKV